MPLDSTAVARRQLARQITHWVLATDGLADLVGGADSQAWASLERYLGVTLRGNLLAAVDRLRTDVAVLRALHAAAHGPAELRQLGGHVLAFRARYLRTETLVEFYANAVSARTNPDMALLLRAYDWMARQSMAPVLERTGQAVPPVLTYFDRGLGASILKAGLRLWDGGTLSAAAAIKVTYHNRRRPTALIHETGHQVAHLIGWNGELAALLGGLPGLPADVAEAWSGWASEIAADAFAFCHTGFAAVAALADVVAGESQQVFRFHPGDPHPISYLRVALGVEMCVRWFGSGPWEELGRMWADTHPLEAAEPGVRQLVRASLPALPAVVEASLRGPLRKLGGRGIADIVDPHRVRPDALRALAAEAGAALLVSPHWLRRESLRLLALSGLRFADEPERGVEILTQQEDWLRRLGAVS